MKLIITAIDLNGNNLNNNTTNTQPNTPSNSTFEAAPVGITSSNFSPTPQPDSDGSFASSFSGLTGLTASIASGFTNDIKNTFL